MPWELRALVSLGALVVAPSLHSGRRQPQGPRFTKLRSSRSSASNLYLVFPIDMFRMHNSNTLVPLVHEIFTLKQTCNKLSKPEEVFTWLENRLCQKLTFAHCGSTELSAQGTLLCIDRVYVHNSHAQI